MNPVILSQPDRCYLPYEHRVSCLMRLREYKERWGKTWRNAITPRPPRRGGRDG